MIGVVNGKIKRVPLAECAGKLKMVSPKDQTVKAAKQKMCIRDRVHQINTPIANIKMYSEFLREDSLTTEEYRHFADNLDRQARKLSWLGEGFAKISRMETGIISLKPEIQPVDVSKRQT